MRNLQNAPTAAALKQWSGFAQNAELIRGGKAIVGATVAPLIL